MGRIFSQPRGSAHRGRGPHPTSEGHRHWGWEPGHPPRLPLEGPFVTELAHITRNSSRSLTIFSRASIRWKAFWKKSSEMEDQNGPSCGPYTHACAHAHVHRYACAHVPFHVRMRTDTHTRTRIHALVEKKGGGRILQEMGVETGPLSQLNCFLSANKRQVSEVWRSWGTLCQEQMQAQGWEPLVLGFTSSCPRTEHPRTAE